MIGMVMKNQNSIITTTVSNLMRIFLLKRYLKNFLEREILSFNLTRLVSEQVVEKVLKYLTLPLEETPRMAKFQPFLRFLIKWDKINKEEAIMEFN